MSVRVKEKENKGRRWQGFVGWGKGNMQMKEKGRERETCVRGSPVGERKR